MGITTYDMQSQICPKAHHTTVHSSEHRNLESSKDVNGRIWQDRSWHQVNENYVKGPYFDFYPESNEGRRLLATNPLLHDVLIRSGTVPKVRTLIFSLWTFFFYDGICWDFIAVAVFLNNRKQFYAGMQYEWSQSAAISNTQTGRKCVTRQTQFSKAHSFGQHLKQISGQMLVHTSYLLQNTRHHQTPKKSFKPRRTGQARLSFRHTAM